MTRISFAATILVLTVLALLGYAFFPPNNGVIVRHIPPSFPQSSGIIGDFTPSDAVQVSFNNFTAVRSINSSALPVGNYLSFTKPDENVTSQSIDERVTVVLSKPNATVDITILNNAALSRLEAAFAGALTPAAQIGVHPAYSTNSLINKTVVDTWVSFVGSISALVTCYTPGAGQSALTRVLSVLDGSTPSILTIEGAQRLLYVANGTGGHLGLSIQNFAGAVTTGKMTLVTVDSHPTDLSVNHFVEFSNVTQAQSQVTYFKQVYIGSNKFESYDEVLVAIQPQSLGSIVQAIAEVG
jgi:hypothetical protein